MREETWQPSDEELHHLHRLWMEALASCSPPQARVRQGVLYLALLRQQLRQLRKTEFRLSARTRRSRRSDAKARPRTAVQMTEVRETEGRMCWLQHEVREAARWLGDEARGEQAALAMGLREQQERTEAHEDRRWFWEMRMQTRVACDELDDEIEELRSRIAEAKVGGDASQASALVNELSRLESIRTDMDEEALEEAQELEEELAGREACLDEVEGFLGRRQFEMEREERLEVTQDRRWWEDLDDPDPWWYEDDDYDGCEDHDDSTELRHAESGCLLRLVSSAPAGRMHASTRSRWRGTTPNDAARGSDEGSTAIFFRSTSLASLRVTVRLTYSSP